MRLTFERPGGARREIDFSEFGIRIVEDGAFSWHSWSWIARVVRRSSGLELQLRAGEALIVERSDEGYDELKALTERMWRIDASGRFVWIVEVHEMRMSHFVDSGALWRVGDEHPLFEASHLWSLDGPTWRGAVISFRGRKYPGAAPMIDLHLDAENQTASIARDEGDADKLPSAPQGYVSFSEALRWLDAYPAITPRQ